MCTRCNQKYGGTADSQDSIALGSGLHGGFTAMTFVLRTAKLQKKLQGHCSQSLGILEETVCVTQVYTFRLRRP